MLMREVFSLARDVPLAGYWRLGSATDIWSRVCGLLPHDPFTFASTGLVRAEAACPGGPRSASLGQRVAWIRCTPSVTSERL